MFYKAVFIHLFSFNFDLGYHFLIYFHLGDCVALIPCWVRVNRFTLLLYKTPSLAVSDYF